MSSLGIRRFIKSNVKRALGIEPGADTTPPNWQSRPPAPEAYTPPAEPVPAPTVEPVQASAASSAPEAERPEPSPAAAVAEAAPVAEVASAPSTVTADAADDEVGPPLTLEAVQEILDEMVRPALQSDGGDIALIKVEDRNIYVKLVGACSTCPSSIMTMKMGVEALLKEEFPSMNELVDVGAAAPPA